MQSTLASQKSNLRISTRKLITAMSAYDRQESDKTLFQAFLALPEVEQAQTIFLFWGITGLEPDTSRLANSLLKLGKKVCLPRVTPNFGMETRTYCPEIPMLPTAYGILEPTEECPLVPMECIDLTLVPALCYDAKGNRLGYGAGYYDRWLKQYSGLTVGLCRERTLQRAIPMEEHDRPVHIVVTERQIIRPTAPAAGLSQT